MILYWNSLFLRKLKIVPLAISVFCNVINKESKHNENKYAIGKKITIFIVGSLILSLGISVLLYEPLGNFLNRLSEDEIRDFAANPFYEITRTSFNIYVIAYILFTTLPEKIKKAKLMLKGIYFIFFYLLCYIIYIWI